MGTLSWYDLKYVGRQIWEQNKCCEVASQIAAVNNAFPKHLF